MRGRLAPDSAHHDRQEAADHQVAGHRQQGTAAAEVEPRGHEADAGREHDQDRLVDLAELRDAEVELGLEGRERHEEAAHQERAAHVVDPWSALALGVAADRGDRLAHQHHAAERRERRAADQHQVGRAPERHVLAEEPVPHVVQREAGERERATCGHHQPADGRPPVAAEMHGGLRGALGAGQRDRHDARHEHPVEADQDQVVSGVRERSGVTAVVDVQRDVPVHAEHGREERDSKQHRGHGRPRGQARVPVRPARNASQDLQLSAAMTRDQVGHERRCDERAGRGPDGLADGGSARRLLAGGLRERRGGVREHDAENASKENPGAAHVLSSSGRLNWRPGDPSRLARNLTERSVSSL